MSRGALTFFIKLGLISEDVVSPRNVTGIARIVLSLVAVAFSYFFIHISFFGPPVSEVFKGTFLLGVIVLSILLFRSRRRPIREGVVWLDEIFALVDTAALCAMIAVGVMWAVTGQTELWRDFVGAQVWIVMAIGGLIGAGIYAFEAKLDKLSDNPMPSDVLFLVGAVLAIAWWIYSAVDLTERIGGPVPVPVVFFSGILAAASFEIARRIVGPVIPLIGALFFIYTFKPVAQALPGLLNHPGFTLDRIMEFLMLATDGMTGLIIDVFATYVVIFVILGAFLEKTGLGSLIIDATYRMTGQRTGGPGLAAVCSSGLFGMISGSGVANVVTTGTFTIPLMKRVGYKAEFAAAVEAAASTGGAYMPPIMGAGAFLLAELTETSYFEVIKIALIPAVLYYLSVVLMVYFRARRRGLHGVPVSELPAWERIVPRLHLLLPIPVMVYLLVIGDSAFLAAAKTIVLIVLLRAVDLLVAVRTPWSGNSWKYFLPISLAFGVLVYFFGADVGAPFTWFINTYVGFTIGDALYWVVAAFIILKVVEVILAGVSAEMGAIPNAVAEAGLGAEIRPSRPHNGALRCLYESYSELVRNIWVSMEAGAKNTLVIGCIAGVLGILLSSATQSDLPGRVSALLVELSFGLLPLTIFWVIVAGYVIGMGLPIVASYVILAIFAVGALTNLGVPVLAAHMISYWVAVVSAVTPPVALAAYAASAIAQSDPVKTGNEAVRLASMIFLMPVLFVYTPLLLDGGTAEIVVTVVATFLGVVAWAMFLEAPGTKTGGSVMRFILGLAVLCLLLPVDHAINYFLGVEQSLHYETYAIGVVLLALALVGQRRAARAVLKPAE